MLVDIAEFVNLPKGVIFRGGAGLKGLELLDFLCSGRTDTLYYSYSSGFIRKPRSSLDLVNGKLSQRVWYSSGLDNQLPYDVVENRSEVVKGLSDQKTAFRRDRGAFEDQTKLLGLGIILGDNLVRVDSDAKCNALHRLASSANSSAKKRSRFKSPASTGL